MFAIAGTNKSAAGQKCDQEEKEKKTTSQKTATTVNQQNPSGPQEQKQNSKTKQLTHMVVGELWIEGTRTRSHRDSDNTQQDPHRATLHCAALYRSFSCVLEKSNRAEGKSERAKLSHYLSFVLVLRTRVIHFFPKPRISIAERFFFRCFSLFRSLSLPAPLLVSIFAQKTFTAKGI